MTATLTIEPGYPPTVNDEGFAGFALAVAADLLGAANTGRMPAPVMGAEDFSYVLEQTPGALAFLGVCPPGVRPAQAHSCHSNRMLLDEDAMPRRNRSPLRGRRALLRDRRQLRLTCLLTALRKVECHAQTHTW